MTKKIDTELLNADAAGIAQAAALLKSGALVAFPTETVYGLGADARNGAAVAAIYAAKERPQFNPLIVHLPSLGEVSRYGVITPVAEAFLADGWPESLTLVLPLRTDAGLSSLVTAGLESVALRVPHHPLAQVLLAQVKGPIAAPSANPSGRISPTTAAHVMNGLQGRIAAVLDGGATTAGLESTIVDATGNAPVVLREGAWSAPATMARALDVAGAPKAPGQLASHYAPLATVRLNATEALDGEVLLGFGAVVGEATLSTKGDVLEAAAVLYARLHEMDARGVMRLAVAPIPDIGIGRAINDRLRRAAAPRG